MWTSAAATEECDPSMRTARAAPAASVAPPPAPRAQPAPAPVEVQPLAASPIRDEGPLEPELAVAPDSMRAPAPIPEPQPQRNVMEPMVLSTDALFPLSSYAIKPGARENLDTFVAEVLEADYDTIKITGHTDPTGPAALNARLSRQRAEAVKRYLVARGVEPDRIVTEGVGSSQPIVTDVNCSSLPRAKKIACYQPDRRVEIEVKGARVARDTLRDEPLGAR
jgi:OOP family OmpA-OmpF porin